MKYADKSSRLPWRHPLRPLFVSFSIPSASQYHLLSPRAGSMPGKSTANLSDHASVLWISRPILRGHPTPRQRAGRAWSRPYHIKFIPPSLRSTSISFISTLTLTSFSLFMLVSSSHHHLSIYPHIAQSLRPRSQRDRGLSTSYIPSY